MISKNFPEYYYNSDMTNIRERGHIWSKIIMTTAIMAIATTATTATTAIMAMAIMGTTEMLLNLQNHPVCFYQSMQRKTIESLLAYYPMLSYHNVCEAGVPNGAWFEFSTKPLPPANELEKIASDVFSSDCVEVCNDGSLMHFDECHNLQHSLEPSIKEAIKSMKPQSFRIAIWENKTGIYHSQPIVICLEPEISLLSYPDHPHINRGGQVDYFSIPDSLCYISDPKDLGEDDFTRIKSAIQQVCIWLFRHQIWLETRNNGNSVWIGEGHDIADKDQFSFLRNPNGICRCGRKEAYKDCHLNDDFCEAVKAEPVTIDQAKILSTFSKSTDTIDVQKYSIFWVTNRLAVQQSSISKLKKILLN